MEDNLKELICRRESENDGQSIYLYHAETDGHYVGYGLSAYYCTSLLDNVAAFSEELGIPMMVLDKNDVLKLKGCLQVAEHEKQRYYHFRLPDPIGRHWYRRWIENIRHQ